MASQKHTTLFACILLFPILSAAAEDWHPFTDKTGRKLEATVIRVEATFAVLKLKSSGKEVPIGFDKFSEEDVRYLRSSEWETTAAKTNPAPNTTEETSPEGDPEKGRLYPKTKEEIRATIREIGKRPRPDGISSDIHKATQNLNIYRYLCGISYDVQPDAEFSKSAEDAALACKANGALSHGLGHSTDKCNLSSGAELEKSVTDYVEDSGDNNREARGHRAWCLNPPMKRVGFGSGGAQYSAMWCMNSDGKSMRDSWTYPGKGLFPLEYMHGTAWSLYGPNVNPSSIDKVTVKMFRLTTRPDKPFSATADIPGREVPVKYISKAMMNGINFEPKTQPSAAYTG